MEIKKYIWPLCTVIVLLECLFFLPGYIRDVFVRTFWGNPIEITNRGLGEIYTTVDDRYAIGKQLGHIQICDKYITYGCLEGAIRGLRILKNNKRALIYFEPLNKKAAMYPEGFNNQYRYNLFWHFDVKTTSSRDRIPKFMAVWLGSIPDLYDEINLKDAFPEEQKIFKELEKNPTIVINGVDYTHKKLN